MPRRYPLAEADDDFLDTAPLRFRHVVALDAPATRVWRALSADDALVSWSRLITGARWTSPRPFGPGSTRAVTLGGVLTLTERFFRWDTGNRMTFTVDEANRPGLRRFAEDLVLEPCSGGTRLVWTFAVEPARWLTPVAVPTLPLVRRATAGLHRGLALRVRELPAEDAG
ncbi:SRPBCC family protein [Prauserella cavernicola]|uniref:SRPBCC family protein n=1 Tax=Prauserella cavernicola TaxID=2800127 RepID=A0A934QLR1_9PSEU|nr:SRPBCC family protein [Prauserella cavernicola]MBK1783412.1 SRPBCC family protein [Prauserella cavernicola]